MFPLRDENPTEIFPFVTILIIAVNSLVWLVVQGAGRGEPFLQSLCAYGTIPGEVTGALSPGALVRLGQRATCRIGGMGPGTLLTSMFMHGSWMHLIGNMWFLWVFGNNIEDSMGHGRFVVFYLLAGLIAAGAHILSAPESPLPTVGASGAISGVMGAYLILYPRVRVYTAIIFFFFIRVIPLPAWTLLFLWFLIQLVQGAFAASGVAGGVAVWAHVGGFVAGVALIRLFVKRKLVAAKHEGRVLTNEELGRFGRW